MTAAEAKESAQNGGAPEPEINYGGWKAMPYVIGNETFEKLGTTGTASNLLVYLTTVFHMKSVDAAMLLNVFLGTTNLTPLFGAFLSDSYFGRYATLGVASIASFLGMVILTLTAGIPSLHPTSCNQSDPTSCSGPTRGQLAVLLSSFVFLIIGAGGIRPCNLAFGADQFNPKTESGKRGINSFFNWYYFTFTVAMMISSTFIIYVQSNISWSLGLAIPTVLMLFSCVFFFVGTRIYVKVKPEGSPFTSIAQVLVAAIKKRNLKLDNDEFKDALFDPPHRSTLVAKLPRTDQFRFLDKAAIITTMDEITSSGLPANGWRLCGLQQVEEVKCLARIIPIWSTVILLQVSAAQLSTYAVFQALQSDRRLGRTTFQVPAATFSIVFPMVAMTFWIPIYDRVIVPRLHKITGIEGGITLLQRMGTGIAISIITMLISGFVEQTRRSLAIHSNSGFVSPMSTFWLTPQLVLSGLSEACTLIGLVEFNYKQFPENMRSLAGGLLFLAMACSNYINTLWITIVHRVTGGNHRSNWLAGDLNQGRLDLNYYSIAGMCAINLVFFLVFAKWYRYKSSDKAYVMALQTVVVKSSD